jgi:orotidine-5'-phosphate decarboxylase
VKLGVPAVFALGPEFLGELTSSFNKSYFFVCDSKMADIGHVNRLVAEQIFDLGFDALIIHAAIGVKQGIDEVVDLAEKMGKGVLGLCAMSHPGADEHLNKHLETLLKIAASAGVDGFILPATYPELIARARGDYPSSIIISPGTGAQGAPIGSAISAGADFEIIGRAISSAPSPAEKAKEINKEMKKWV